MPTDNQKLLKDEIIKFKLNHFKNVDFKYWQAKISRLYSQLQKLKDQSKRNRCIMDLYTNYLQMTEILFINICTSFANLEFSPSILFISNKNIKKYISDNFTNSTKTSEIFLKNYSIVAIKQDEKTMNLYRNLLMEIAKDYIDNHELLNAFKHGYRITAKNEKMALSIGSGNQMFKINETDSSATYYYKKLCKESGCDVICERTINFNNGRVFVKSLFVSSLIENLRAAVLLSMGKEVKAGEYFYIDDMNSWNKSFGGSAFDKEIFRFAKRKPHGK